MHKRTWANSKGPWTAVSLTEGSSEKHWLNALLCVTKIEKLNFNWLWTVRSWRLKQEKESWKKCVNRCFAVRCRSLAGYEVWGASLFQIKGFFFECVNPSWKGTKRSLLIYTAFSVISDLQLVTLSSKTGGWKQQPVFKYRWHLISDTGCDLFMKKFWSVLT